MSNVIAESSAKSNVWPSESIEPEGKQWYVELFQFLRYLLVLGPFEKICFLTESITSWLLAQINAHNTLCVVEYHISIPLSEIQSSRVNASEGLHFPP